MLVYQLECAVPQFEVPWLDGDYVMLRCLLSPALTDYISAIVRVLFARKELAASAIYLTTEELVVSVC